MSTTQWEKEIFGFNNRGIVSLHLDNRHAICENCGAEEFGDKAMSWQFGHIGCPKPNGEYIRNDVTPDKIRKAFSQALQQEQTNLREELMRLFSMNIGAYGESYGRAIKDAIKFLDQPKEE